MTVKFRKYQKRMIEAQNKFMANPDADRATILCATGGGKTEVFNDLMLNIATAEGAAQKRILVVHPRIALSQNQQKRLAKTFFGMAEFTNFHSGQSKQHTLPGKKNTQTTSRVILEEIMAAAPDVHITFSSYKSLHKIADMDFDLIVCDEAHYLVQSDLRKNLHLFKSKTLFYTGTPVVVAATEESMDNVELFGETIAEVLPRELIPNGYIVRPRVRTINVRSNDSGNTEDYATTIAYAFKDQQELSHKDFVHKMLVAMPNVTSFSFIMGELSNIREIVGNPYLDFYYVTSHTCSKNGRVFADRELLLEDFASNENQCIIMHCDTLAEGIDIDGIAGVLIMRGLGMVKAIQTVGRGCRAALADIIKSGSRKGEIRKNRIKTECIVTIARFNNQWASDRDIGWWCELFESGGYNKGELLADLELQQAKTGPGSEIGEPDDAIINELLDHRITESQTTMWSELWESA